MTPEQRIQTIRERLTTALQPTQLDIIDDSAKHAGHLGSQGGGGHYTVRIAAPAFTGKKLLETHRMVYTALGDLMQHEIHALQIQIVTA